MNVRGNALINFMISVLLGLLVALIIFGAAIVFDLSQLHILIMIIILAIVYAIILPLILRPFIPRNARLRDIGEIKRAVNSPEDSTLKDNNIDDIKYEISRAFNDSNGKVKSVKKKAVKKSSKKKKSAKKKSSK